MKKKSQKNLIYKILDFIYLIFKSTTLFLIPYPKKIKKIVRRIRRLRLTAFFLILTFGLTSIVYFFLIHPIKDYGVNLADNQRFLDTYFDWEKDIENKVEAFREKKFPDYFLSDNYQEWKRGEISVFQIDPEEITRINELDSTIRIKGRIQAEYYPENIRSAFLNDGPITLKAKEDILSVADLNFASTEERLFEPIAETIELNEGWRRSTYRFEGDFPLERDLTKFPFDKATWRLRIIFPLEAYAINPEFNSGSSWYNFSKINAYEPDVMPCGEDNLLYSNCLNIELFDKLTFVPEAYDDSTHVNYQEAKLDYFLVLSESGALKRSISSSFVRYLMPIIFSIMVLSLTDQLSSRESWEIKVAIPPTVLLTLIFMQNTYHSQIPQLAYITWLDELYLLAYLASILMLINAVVSKGDWFNNGKIDLDARLKLNYLIRNIFVFVVIVMPFVTYLT